MIEVKGILGLKVSEPAMEDFFKPDFKIPAVMTS